MKNEHHVIDAEKHLQSATIQKHQNTKYTLISLSLMSAAWIKWLFTDCAQVSEEPAEALAEVG